MIETEPLYFKEFRKHIDQKFIEADKNMKSSIEELAISTARGFSEMDRRFDKIHEDFATKSDLYETETRLGRKIDKLDERVEKIEGHIGRYEIRAQNIEEIMLPRIKNLEKAFLAI